MVTHLEVGRVKGTNRRKDSSEPGSIVETHTETKAMHCEEHCRKVDVVRVSIKTEKSEVINR